MKRFYNLVIWMMSMLLVMFLFITCESGKKSEENTANNTPQAEADRDTGEAKPFKVVYLLNGTLGSQGFSDNAASGVYRLRDELGCAIKVVEMGNNQTSYDSYFLDESEKDWDLIIGATFTLRDLVEQMAVAYPEQNYLYIDGEINFTNVTTNNVIGITYQSNETGFMAGALAALMLDSNDGKIDPAKRILGFVGSADTPNINDFLIGYIEGIKLIDPGIKLFTSYVGSFEDVPKCMEMTTQLYNQGAQIVYGPTSGSILGAVQAAASKEKYFIACDNDIWSMIQANDPEMVRNVISSSMKNVGDSIFNAVTGYQQGTYQMGKNYILGIKDGAVGLAKNDNYTKLVPADIRLKLDAIADQITNGSIKVNTAFGMATGEVAKLRDSMKP